MASIKSTKDIKKYNASLVLSCIVQHTSVSRVEIADITGLAPSTVGQAAGQLLKEGIVLEQEQGVSTGGRKPIFLQINPEYGVTVVFELCRNGIFAKTFYLNEYLVSQTQLSSRLLCGNHLLDVLVKHTKEIQEVHTVIAVGLLCQDDIPEYDLTVEFSTGAVSDIIRLDVALATSCNVPVQKELINRYNLETYLQQSNIKCENYAYLNLGERVTASFVLGNTLVHNARDTVFDLSAAVLAGNYADSAVATNKTISLGQELALKRLSPEALGNQLVQVLTSALLFFPVDNVYICGDIEKIDEVVDFVTKHFYMKLAIWKVDFTKNHVEVEFAKRIFLNNYANILTNV